MASWSAARSTSPTGAPGPRPAWHGRGEHHPRGRQHPGADRPRQRPRRRLRRAVLQLGLHHARRASWSGCAPEAPISHVTINGNRFTGPFGEDALQLKNFRDVVVQGNEITQVREDSSHNDCTQTVFGGDGLVYRDNYQHDNRCQGLFIKDGRVTNVDVEDNLFVHNDLPCLNKTCADGAPLTLTLYDTVGMTFRNNVLWDNQGGSMLQDGNSGLAWDHNVIASFTVYSTTPYRNAANLTEDFDVFGTARNWASSMGSHSLEQAAPTFRDRATNDYRLASPVTRGGATYAAGVTWRPTDIHYGP